MTRWSKYISNHLNYSWHLQSIWCKFIVRTENSLPKNIVTCSLVWNWKSRRKKKSSFFFTCNRHVALQNWLNKSKSMFSLKQYKNSTKTVPKNWQIFLTSLEISYIFVKGFEVISYHHFLHNWIWTWIPRKI